MTRVLVLLHLCVGVWVVAGDLVVNVRNQGGESYKQTIRANLTEETVTLNFEGHDGGRTLLAIDFRNEIQLVHVIRLGDQEENDLMYQGHQGVEFDNVRRAKGFGVLTPAVYKSYCFVTKFKPNEFIPVDAMAKLRQKNPWSLRTPERNEPPQNVSFDILLDATASDWISPVIREHCVGDVNFETTTYAIKMEISEKAVNPEDYLRSVRDITVIDDRGCDDSFRAGGCVCSSAVCIGWYPCALKFCRTRSSGGSSNGTNSVGGGGNGGGAGGGSGGAGGGGSSTGAPDNFKTYRCGIHTCRICRNYFFGVRGVTECL